MDNLDKIMSALAKGPSPIEADIEQLVEWSRQAREELSQWPTHEGQRLVQGHCEQLFIQRGQLLERVSEREARLTEFQKRIISLNSRVAELEADRAITCAQMSGWSPYDIDIAKTKRHGMGDRTKWEAIVEGWDPMLPFPKPRGEGESNG